LEPFASVDDVCGVSRGRRSLHLLLHRERAAVQGVLLGLVFTREVPGPPILVAA
jgi:hypothetical protein